MSAKKLYLAVTPDRYELPLAVCLSADELGRYLGISGRSVLQNMNRKQSGTQRGYNLVRIEIEEDETDENCVKS